MCGPHAGAHPSGCLRCPEPRHPDQGRPEIRKAGVGQGDAHAHRRHRHDQERHCLDHLRVGAATGANGTFTGTFAVNDPVLVEGTNLNNGYFTATALDTVNAAFLMLDPPPKAEGPITATLRTP